MPDGTGILTAGRAAWQAAGSPYRNDHQQFKQGVGIAQNSTRYQPDPQDSGWGW